MYCTPKIHKPGISLRPIVDYTGSIGYNASRYLADILKKVVGKTSHRVKNSSDLVETLSGMVIWPDEILNSHDVVSLFTNTPVDKALEVIQHRIAIDQQWREVTKMEVDNVIVSSSSLQHTSGLRSVIQTAIWCGHEQSSLSIGGRHVHGVPGTKNSHHFT